jgi:cytochrome c6
LVHKNSFIVRLFIIAVMLILPLFMITCKSGEYKPEQEAAALFKTYCVNCHGIDGSLMTNGAKDLRFSVLSLDERVMVISEGRNVMTAFGNTLSKEQILAVAQYTFQLADTKGK